MAAPLTTEAAAAIYRALFEAGDDPIFVTNSEGRILDANSAALALLGYTRAEFLELHVRDILLREHAERAAEFTRPRRDGVWRGELQLRRNDGSVVWTETRSVQVDLPEGTRYFGTFRDVTPLKEAKETLRRSEERFRTAFDHAPNGMAILGLDGRYVRVNAALCGLTGYTEPELLTKMFQSITHPDDLGPELAQVDRLLAGEISVFQREKRYLRKDGEVVWIRANSSLVRDEHGAPLSFISQIEDITARKRANDELRAALEAAQAANRAKGVFLDLMSHELRTPLQAVLGYSEFLLIAPKGSLTGDQREDIGYIHQAGGRMIGLVNQLLDLSRMEVGHLELATEPVDIVQVVEQVRQDVAPQAAAKGLVLQIDLPEALPVVIGDAERVRQILLNLAGNAVKFTREGRICITAAVTSSGGVDIEVSDTGIGIAAAALVHIFETFHQVNNSLTRPHGGSGLGLAIAWKLAEQMRGSISVSSQPGVGSIFQLHLPAGQR